MEGIAYSWSEQVPDVTHIHFGSDHFKFTRVDMTTMHTCYQCDTKTVWLAPDGRCGDCTGCTPEEVRGEV
jgi:hypothetical protein